MTIKVIRYEFGKNHTVGELWVNDERIGYTLEDTVRELRTIRDKVPGKTAIPYGEYDIDMETVSPRFARSGKYNDINNRLPRLKNVPFFDGVLIHKGNSSEDSEGCLLVGMTHLEGKDFIGNSKACFDKLYKGYMLPARTRREKITIQITKK